jgi:hypothetical protein
MPQTCDYGVLRTEFAGLFEKSRPCVISGDIDGVLSAVLMGHVLGWPVVGVYTLNDLWVLRSNLRSESKGAELALEAANMVFLDHDVYRTRIASIGHHLIQWSPETPIPQHTEGRASLNPNLLRGITKKEFGRKYPFGTFHFLLACASAWGLLKDFTPDDLVTALLLHIDSSFINAMNYQDNALDWLNWLGGSDERSPPNPICRRMLKFTPKVILEQSRELARRLKDMGIRPRSQGSISDPTDAQEMTRLRNLMSWFEAETGWKSHLADFASEDLVHFSMERGSGKPTKGNFLRIIEAKPFSYAIIGSDAKGFNYNWFAGHVPSASKT